MSFRSSFPILYSADLPRALAFYRDRLGFAEAFTFPDEQGGIGYASLTLGDSRLGLGRADLPALHGQPLSPVSGHRVEICVYADDVDAAVADLRDAGVPVLVEPADMPWGARIAFVEDPDGNPVHITTP